MNKFKHNRLIMSVIGLFVLMGAATLNISAIANKAYAETNNQVTVTLKDTNSDYGTLTFADGTEGQTKMVSPGTKVQLTAVPKDNYVASNILMTTDDGDEQNSRLLSSTDGKTFTAVVNQNSTITSTFSERLNNTNNDTISTFDSLQFATITDASIHNGVLDWIAAATVGKQSLYSCTVTLPDGQVLPGGCYESFIGDPNHGKYYGPGNGSYVIDPEETAKANAAHAGDGYTYVVINPTYDGRPKPPASTPTLPPGVTDCQRIVTRYVAHGSVALTKTSANTTVTNGNSCYSLEGAQFGVYSDAAATNQVGTLQTDSNGYAKLDDLIAGTYYVKEIKAPKGYLADTTIKSVVVPAGGTGSVEFADTPSNDPFAFMLIKAGTEFGKPQGGASFEGAQYKMKFYPSQISSVSDAANATATDELILTTDKNGRVIFSKQANPSNWKYVGNANNAILPLGTVTIQEIKPPTGYLLDNTVYLGNIVEDGKGGAKFIKTWSNKFEQKPVNTDGSVNAEANDGVMRQDISFSKKDQNGKDKMSNVPFLITSKTTGESHVVVTDENGVYDSTAQQNTNHTNGNDAAVTKDENGKYIVDDSKLDNNDGLWFYGVSEGKGGEVSDKRGSFVYDEYTAQELPSAANAGHTLVTFNFTMHKNDNKLDYGTIYDDIPFLSSQASVEDGDVQEVIPSKDTKLKDEVTYTNFQATHKYTLTTTLHLVGEDGSDAGVITDESGNPITEIQEFTPDTPNGTIESHIKLDASKYAGQSVVFYESVSENGSDVIKHEKIDDVKQRIYFTDVHTTATSKDGKAVDATAKITITDDVEYLNLRPNTKYTVTGTFHTRDKDGKDAGVLKDAQGKDVTATTEFTTGDANNYTDETKDDEEPTVTPFDAQPTNSAQKSDGGVSGKVRLTFTFDGSAIKDTCDIVAFESITHNNSEVAVHADINDEGQKVRISVPKIKTTATADGKKTVDASAKMTIVDTVEYEGLRPNTEYNITSTLHIRDAQGNDKGVLKDAQGKDVTVTGKFTTGDATTNDKNPSTEAATQPSTIQTRDVSTTDAATTQAESPTSESTKDSFASVSGKTDVKFEFDGSKIDADTDVVAFESVNRDDVDVIKHEDISDKGQTVNITVPPIPTEGKDYGKTGASIAAAIICALVLGGAGVAIGSYAISRKKVN